MGRQKKAPSPWNQLGVVPMMALSSFCPEEQTLGKSTTVPHTEPQCANYQVLGGEETGSSSGLLDQTRGRNCMQGQAEGSRPIITHSMLTSCHCTFSKSLHLLCYSAQAQPPAGKGFLGLSLTQGAWSADTYHKDTCSHLRVYK